MPTIYCDRDEVKRNSLIRLLSGERQIALLQYTTPYRPRPLILYFFNNPASQANKSSSATRALSLFPVLVIPIIKTRCSTKGQSGFLIVLVTNELYRSSNWTLYAPFTDTCTWYPGHIILACYFPEFTTTHSSHQTNHYKGICSLQQPRGLFNRPSPIWLPSEMLVDNFHIRVFFGDTLVYPTRLFLFL